jgi:hypothetical protein
MFRMLTVLVSLRPATLALEPANSPRADDLARATEIGCTRFDHFSKKAAPLLASRCASCHSDQKAKGGTEGASKLVKPTRSGS